MLAYGLGNLPLGQESINGNDHAFEQESLQKYGHNGYLVRFVRYGYLLQDEAQLVADSRRPLA